MTIIRGKTLSSVRDNVLFELGLFVGRLGAERSFFIVPEDADDFRLPSDLYGVTYPTFDSKRPDGNWEAALGPACNLIRSTIARRFSLQEKYILAWPQPMLDKACYTSRPWKRQYNPCP
jgi:predicted nucleotide-binding protein